MKRVLIVVCIMAGSSGSMAQPSPPLPQLLGRVTAYITAYEHQLSSVVADERFDQRVSYTRTYDMGRPVNDVDRRRLDSEIGFIRLPGGLDWLGFRNVKKVDGRAVASKAGSIADALSSTSNVMGQAGEIARASAAHNLGLPRTTNVPTAALEIIHPRHFERHAFELKGDERIEGTRVAVIAFNEKRRPPLVVDPSGQELVSRGRIWAAPESGTIWRVEWGYSPPVGSSFSLRVDFRKNDALGMMVPTVMHEVFPSMAGRNARGDGTAVYSNYRRFGTGGRIIPQGEW
jgi:hypothetical protein